MTVLPLDTTGMPEKAPPADDRAKVQVTLHVRGRSHYVGRSRQISFMAALGEIEHQATDAGISLKDVTEAHIVQVHRDEIEGAPA